MSIRLRQIKMSKSHNKLSTIKLTEENRKAIDEMVKVSKKLFLKVSRSAMANKAVGVGIQTMKKKNPDWTNP